MEKWLSVSQLSENTNIPETTVRRYLNKFSTYFRHDHIGKGKKYHPESCEILKKIASLYSKDYGTREIESILSNEFAFSVEAKESKPSVHQSMPDIERQFEEFKAHQESFNRELLQKLEEQQEYIKNHLEQRDKNLMAALKEIQETKKLAAATKQQKKGFWKLWGKKEY